MKPEYELRTVADFLSVPEERIDECLADFRDWLKLARGAALMNATVQWLVQSPGLKLRIDVFRWCDDGQRGASGFRFTDESGKCIGKLDLSSNAQVQPGICRKANTSAATVG